MTLLVFSDSHGAYARMKRVLDQTPCDAVAFLGDGLRDAERLYDHSGVLPVLRVCGNCDLMPVDTGDQLLTTLGGVNVLLTHGHRYGVKSGLNALETAARKMGASLALYGHTHRQRCDEREGLTLVNPGSIRDGRYAVLQIGGKIEVAFYDER